MLCLFTHPSMKRDHPKTVFASRVCVCVCVCVCTCARVCMHVRMSAHVLLCVALLGLITNHSCIFEIQIDINSSSSNFQPCYWNLSSVRIDVKIFLYIHTQWLPSQNAIGPPLLAVRIFPSRDFRGGSVVVNPPANAGGMGSSPGWGRSHMPRSN